MRSVAPESVNVALEPVMIARISREELARLMPVEFHEMEPLAAPEPSLGAVVELGSGRLVAVSYGKITGQLMVEVAPTPEAAAVLLDLLLEAPVDAESIAWVKPHLVAELDKAVAKLGVARRREVDSLLAALAEISAHPQEPSWLRQ